MRRISSRGHAWKRPDSGDPPCPILLAFPPYSAVPCLARVDSEKEREINKQLGPGSRRRQVLSFLRRRRRRLERWERASRPGPRDGGSRPDSWRKWARLQIPNLFCPFGVDFAVFTWAKATIISSMLSSCGNPVQIRHTTNFISSDLVFLCIFCPALF
jgi:hypothetical protein